MSTERDLLPILESCAPVRYINVFGYAALSAGVLVSRKPIQYVNAQGAALLAGKWLRRMEKAGYAKWTTIGWIPAHGRELAEGKK